MKKIIFFLLFLLSHIGVMAQGLIIPPDRKKQQHTPQRSQAKPADNKKNVDDVLQYQYHKGVLYEERQDYDNAIEWYRKAAEKGYAKAFAPLAKLYLKKYDYDNAHIWAVKAGKAKTDLRQAREVITTLTYYGYYEFGEHGGKPKF